MQQYRQVYRQSSIQSFRHISSNTHRPITMKNSRNTSNNTDRQTDIHPHRLADIHRTVHAGIFTKTNTYEIQGESKNVPQGCLPIIQKLFGILILNFTELFCMHTVRKQNEPKMIYLDEKFLQKCHISVVNRHISLLPHSVYLCCRSAEVPEGTG